MANGLTLDAGALIALEGGGRAVPLWLHRAIELELEIAIPAGALAQVWRDGRRQTRLSSLLAHPRVEVVTLDRRTARQAGQLCGVRGTSDVIDASVVTCALERGHVVLSSDPKDLVRLAPDLVVERV